MNRSRSALELTAAFVVVAGVVSALVLAWTIGWPPSATIGALVAAVPGALLFGATFSTSDDVHRRATAIGSAIGVAVLTAVLVQVVVVVGGDGRPAEDDRRLVLLGIVGAALTALIAPAAKRALGAAIERRTAGSPISQAELLRRLDRAVARDTPVDEVILQAAEGLRDTQAASVVEIWTGVPEHLEPAVSLPPRRAAAVAVTGPTATLAARAPVAGRSWAELLMPDLVEQLTVDREFDIVVAPMSATGTLCGLVVLGRQTAFDEAEREAIVEVAARLAPAVDRARLGARLDESLANLRRQAAELQASRERLVSAGDDARQRIERDLHDGVQQRLVAVSLNLGLAERMLAEGRREEAGRLLHELNEEAVALAASLRSLAQGVYPPMLRDEGLVKALAGLAARSPDVTIVGDCGRHPLPLETTVYFCCAEAVANAQKHAPGSSVEIVIDDGGGVFGFEVRDDGRGFDAATVHRGVGLANMEDRVGALGGRLSIDSDSGGTTVRGAIPV